MRKLYLLIILLSTISIAQNSNDGAYNTITEIKYYTGEDVDGDSYKSERCKLDLYYPTETESYATVVWFHGGGLRAGEKHIPEQLKNKGIAIAAVNYRLYPKVNSPVYIEDAAAAVAWIYKHINEFGGDSSLVFVSGHSAGGYLTSMVGLDKHYLNEFGVDADSLAGLIPFSGHTITHFTVREERGITGEQPIVDELAPLYHVRPDAPPLVLITGDRNLEMLGRYEENAYMYRMMKVAGHKYTELYELQGFDHGGMADPAFHILLDTVKKFSSPLKN